MQEMSPDTPENGQLFLASSLEQPEDTASLMRRRNILIKSIGVLANQRVTLDTQFNELVLRLIETNIKLNQFPGPEG